MQDREDDNFDLQLREHFARELDGQLGRAPAAFARSSRRRPWRVSLAWTSGLAAAAAIALVVSLLRHPTVIPSDTNTGVVAPVALAGVDYRTAWRTSDAGTVYLGDEEPMRSIRRDQVEVVSWVDPSTHAQIEVTIPHEEVMLISLNTY